MEIVKLLEKEHQEVRDLFQQFFGGGTLTRLVNKMVGSRPRGRKAVAGKICDALDLHMRLEEEVFYPEVRSTGDPELNKQVDEGEREHAGVKEKVARARTLLGDDGALEETMTAIQGDVDHHVREEETEMFPQLRSVMSEQRLGEIGTRYAARKRAEKGGGSRVRRQAGRTRRGVARGPKRGTAKGRKTAASTKRRTAAAGRRSTRATAKRTRR
jgi:iron-sulfur cluster repair protein YtfE (RIC family)